MPPRVGSTPNSLCVAARTDALGAEPKMERHDGERTHEMSTCVTTMMDGLVDCPYSRTGGVDVEICYRCPRLRAFYDEEDGTKVVCSAPPHVISFLFPRLRPRVVH